MRFVHQQYLEAGSPHLLIAPAVLRGDRTEAELRALLLAGGPMLRYAIGTITGPDTLACPRLVVKAILDLWRTLGSRGADVSDTLPIEVFSGLAQAMAAAGMFQSAMRALAYTERLAGSLMEALRLTEAAAAVAREAAADGDVARALALKARVLHDLGRVDESDACFLEVRRMGHRSFARRSFWEAEHGLALGRVAAARAEVEGNLAGLRDALHLAGLAALTEGRAGARALLGETERVRAELRHPGLAATREALALAGES